MELNGVANIKLLTDHLRSELAENETIVKNFDKINEQLDVLERYMLAYGEYTEAIKNSLNCDKNDLNCDKNTPPKEPVWHEVRADRLKYLNAREKMENFKKQMFNQPKGA